MHYLVLTYLLPTDRLDEVIEALVAIGWTSFSAASRHDGFLDLEVTGAGGEATEAEQCLAGLGLTPSARAVRSEAEILAGTTPDEPCELCPGVWIDPRGDLSADGRLVLRIPPSPAFGDGRHPTTRMLAGWIMNLAMDGAPVLDLGCGTGVLGILAHHRGARMVFTDVDPNSVRTCRDRALANGVPDPVVVRSDLLAEVPAGPYRVIIANIYADLLLEVAADPRLDLLLPTGDLLLSGISSPKADSVLAACAARGWQLRERCEEAWWTALWLVRNKPPVG